MQEISNTSRLDKIASSLLTLIVGLTPLFFIPFSGIAIETSKAYFLGFGIALVVALWAIARMIEGKITFPRSPALFVVLLLPIIYALSAFFSPASNVSFGGVTLNTGTVFFSIISSLLCIAAAFYLNTTERINRLLKIFATIFTIGSLYQIGYIIFGSKYLNLGTFFTASANSVGKLNDLALWYTCVTITMLLISGFVPLRKFSRIGSGLIVVISLFFLAVANFSLAWILVAISSLVIFVLALAQLRRDTELAKRHFPLMPFVVLLVSLLFILANPVVGGLLPQKLGISETEVRPSVQTTMDVTWQSIKHDPLLGIGPDRFANAWLLHRPNAILATQFWDVTFVSGFGTIPSLLVTTGILGFSTLLAFLILFLLTGFLHAFKTDYEDKSRFHILGSFLLAVFGWIIAIVYNPGIVVVALTFVASGVFIGLLQTYGRVSVHEIEFLKDPRKTFFAVVFLVIILLASLSSFFVSGRAFASLLFFAQANKASAQNNIALTELQTNNALTLSPSDIYYRALSSVELAKLGQLLQNDKISQDIVKSEFKNIFSVAEDSARRAVSYDKTNVQNWIALATVYQTVLPLGIDGAYDNAKNAYEEARKLSPESPGFDLLRAGLEVDHKDDDQAKKYIADALTKKPNFTDAYSLLARVLVSEGDTAGAVTQMEKAADIDPRNPDIFSQLGLLKYNTKDYTGAVSAFERSITLNPGDVNVGYFLGLAYDKAGRSDEAKNVFTALLKRLPNNEQLKKIKANLDAGQPALTGLDTSVQQTAPDKTKTILPSATTPTTKTIKKP